MMEQGKSLKRIRKLSRINGKQKIMVAKLPDEQLLFVYEQLQGGISNRAIARALIGQFRVRSTENSLAQSIAKLRSRISPLLARAATIETLQPVPLGKDSSACALPEDRLDRLRSIEDGYAQLLGETISRCREQGSLVPDLHKHTQALASLAKTRARLEQSAPPRPSSVRNNRTLKERADFVLEHYIGDDGNAIIEAGNKFLELAQEKIVEMWPDENGLFDTIPKSRR